MLRRAGLAILLIVVAGVGFVAVGVGAAVGGGAVIAGLVIAIGVALCVSAFVGGARWLVLPALVIAIPLGFVAAAGIDTDGGIGDRDYRPTSLAELRDGYKLGIGELRVDLRDVDLPAGRTPLELNMGIGSVRVLVPEDVCVASDVRVGAGYARVFDRDSAGLDVDWRQSPSEKEGAKRLVIDGNIGVGELQVVHNVTEFDNGGPRAERPVQQRLQLRHVRHGQRARPQRRLHGGRMTSRDFDPASLVAGLVVCGLGVLLLLDQVDAIDLGFGYYLPAILGTVGAIMLAVGLTGRRR